MGNTSDRRSHRRLTQIYKILNNMTRDYLRNILPSTRRAIYARISRNTYHDIPCRRTKYIHVCKYKEKRKRKKVINEDMTTPLRMRA